MAEEFRKMMLGSWVEDREHDLLVRAWTAYYQASDRIDGHIESARSHEERELMRKAMLAGEAAFREVIDDAKYYQEIDREKSKKAQAEALRRLRK